MTSLIKISPSILSGDFGNLGREVTRLEKGGADLIHVDVMDGHFVPNITIGPCVIEDLKKYTKLPLDVHLMVSPVHKYIKHFAKAGSDIITIHPEATKNLKKTIKLIKSYRKKVGIALNPNTSIEKVKPYLGIIDTVLLMSVYPGFGGQKFIKSVLKKSIKLKKEINKKKFKVKIEMDGGINFENSKLVKDAGVDIIVSGTTIFKENKGNIKKNISLLRTR